MAAPVSLTKVTKTQITQIRESVDSGHTQCGKLCLQCLNKNKNKIVYSECLLRLVVLSVVCYVFVFVRAILS